MRKYAGISVASNDVEQEDVGGQEDRERNDSSASAQAKNAAAPRPSASCQEATNTIGTRSDGEQHQEQAEAVDASA